MRELTSTHKITRNYYRELRMRIAEEHTCLADAYRGGGDSGWFLRRIELLEGEASMVSRLSYQLEYLAAARVMPPQWLAVEKHIRYFLTELYHCYENQKVAHPQAISRQYPPEWEHKKH